MATQGRNRPITLLMGALLVLLGIGILPVSAATTGNFATTATAVGTGWANASNAFASNGSYATAAIGRDTTVTTAYANFGFDASVPVGATINSVTIEVEWKVGSSASSSTLGAQAFVSGVASGTELTDLTRPTADVVGTTAATGVTTRTQLLDGTFSVRVRYSRDGSGPPSAITG
jgi:hypothetical protein